VRVSSVLLLPAVTAAAFWLTNAWIAPDLVGSPLAALGLDPERARFVNGLVAAFVAAGAGAVFAGPVVSWLAGSAWFALLYQLPVIVQGLPAPVAGQRLDPAGAVLAGLAQLAMAVALAGLGAASGRGLRGAAGAGLGDLRSGSRRRVLRTLAVLALVALAVFGLWQAPGMLLYGPWQSAYRALPGLTTRQVALDYHSAILGVDQQAIVILPPGYDRSPGTRYPVLYLLHGWPGSARDWPNRGAGAVAAAVAASHRAPPLIVVAPDGNGPRGGARDSWADGYVPGDLAESSLLEELLPEVRAHFRALGDAGHQALGGLSSGGYGAVDIALRHPGTFVLALDFSGDLVPPAGSFGGDLALQRASSPLLLAAAPKPPGASSFFIGWGRQDAYAAVNQRLADQLRASGYSVTTGVAKGGHQWSAWTDLLATGLAQEGGLIGGPVT
jgi:enterochelin esterase-like enzyme